MRFSTVAVALAVLVASQSVTLAQGGGPSLKELLERAKKKPARGAAAQAEPQAQAAAETGIVHERYSINAQYRGTVKKAFMDIGHCDVTYQTQPDGSFNVKVKGNVTDPENKTYKYELDIDADYRQTGARIDRLADRSTFNINAEKHRDRVLKDIPFIYIAKYTAFPQVDRKDTVWNIGRDEVVIRHVRAAAEKEFQVTILERGGTIGKIFLEADEDAPHFIKKFRVMGTNDVVLSFVSPKYSGPKKAGGEE